MNFLMVFDFTQFWLDGRPGNEYFWISHKISGRLTPMTSLGVHPQWFEITLNRYERFLLLCMWEMKDILLTSALQWVTFLNKNSAHKIWAKKDNEIKVSFHHCSKNPYIFISSYTSFSNSWLCQKTQIASRDAKPLMYLYLLRVDIA